MNPLTQAIISGIMMGAVYAMLSIGLVIVYQTAHVINLAHGETYSIAGSVVATIAAAQFCQSGWRFLPPLPLQFYFQLRSNGFCCGRAEPGHTMR